MQRDHERRTQGEQCDRPAAPPTFRRHLPKQQGPCGAAEDEAIGPAFGGVKQGALACKQGRTEGKRGGQSATAESQHTENHRAKTQGRGQADRKGIVVDYGKQPVRDDGIQRRRRVVDGDDIAGAGELGHVKCVQFIGPQFGPQTSRDRTRQKEDREESGPPPKIHFQRSIDLARDLGDAEATAVSGVAHLRYGHGHGSRKAALKLRQVTATTTIRSTDAVN